MLFCAGVRMITSGVGTVQYLLAAVSAGEIPAQPVGLSPYQAGV
jgi:hypothetical protein